MGRPKGSGRGLVAYPLRVEPETYLALQAYAKDRGLALSEAGREVLRAALEADDVLDQSKAEDRGFNEGIRRGLQQVKVAVQEAVADLWK